MYNWWVINLFSSLLNIMTSQQIVYELSRMS